MKLFVTIYLLTLAFAVHAADMRGAIVAYGIYTTDGNDTVKTNAASPSGITRTANQITSFMSTNRIPAKLGLRFGIGYQIENIGLPDGEHDIDVNVRHPEMKRADGKLSTEYTIKQKCTVKDGRASGGSGYGFDHDYELVTGRWTFRVILNGKFICKQEFTVFKDYPALNVRARPN